MTGTRIWCLDTNILVSALVFRGPERSLVQGLRHARKPFLWFPYLEQELREVLVRKFPTVPIDWEAVFPTGTRLNIPDPPAQTVLEAAAILRDPKDGVILAAATWCRPSFLISGDKDIQVLPPIPGLWVGNARQAMGWLSEERENR